MLHRDWVGRRVVVRRVFDVTAGPSQSDVLGDLVDLDERRAVVRTATGLVEIDLATVTAARAVEASTAQQLALERVANAGLAAAEQDWIGGWLLRADPGGTRRANSALPLRTPSRPMADMLTAVARWYRARGLPPRVCVPLPGRRLLDAFLADTAYREPGEAPTGVWRPSPDLTDVLTSRLPPAVTVATSGAVTITAEPTPQWLSVAYGGAGSTAGAALLGRHDQVAFVCVQAQDGRPVAVVRGAVDEGWLGISGLEVDPAHRRAGHARTALTALNAWAVAHGAQQAYLRVSADNQVAAAWCARLGYHRHHQDRYWEQQD